MGNIVITGAAGGIGLALCKAYLARGEKVTVICRKASDDLLDTAASVIDGIDLTVDEDLERLQSTLLDTSIDTLIHNAGLLESDGFSTISKSALLKQFQINAMAPLLVTVFLKNNLHQGSKVALITSRMGSMADNTSGGQYGYRMSKAALNAAGVSLAQDLKLEGIAVALLHPGYVQTKMVGFNGDVSSTVAANRLIARVDDLSIENTGCFWHANGEVLPW